MARPEFRPMRIAALPVTDVVSVRLVNRGDGWQFWHWHRRDLLPIGLRPTDEDRTLSFQDPESAAAYFRRQYGTMLGGAPP